MPRRKRKDERICAYVDLATKQRVARLAEETEESESKIAGRIIKKFFSKDEPVGAPSIN
jgi:hypothetical protein